MSFSVFTSNGERTTGSFAELNDAELLAGAVGDVAGADCAQFLGTVPPRINARRNARTE